MSFEALRLSIETRMAQNYSTTAVAYGNKAFNPPASSAWVRLTIITGQGDTQGMLGDGTPVVRDNGLISIQIFVPDGAGTAVAAGLIDELAAIYEHKRFDGILTYTASPLVVGSASGWHQTNLTIPFRRVRNV